MSLWSGLPERLKLRPQPSTGSGAQNSPCQPGPAARLSEKAQVAGAATKTAGPTDVLQVRSACGCSGMAEIPGETSVVPARTGSLAHLTGTAAPLTRNSNKGSEGMAMR